MSPVKNPYSFFQLLVTYHKKHLYKIIVPWVILCMLFFLTSYFKAQSENAVYEWLNFVYSSLFILLVFYIVYLLFFVVYYFANLYPHKYYLIVNSPLFIKLLFAGILLLVGLPLILGRYNLTIVNYENLLTLSWSIFGISVTFALVTYFLIFEKLSGEKQVVSKLGKIDHNASVLLSLSTFFMLSINVFLLSLSSLNIFLVSRELSRFNEILSQAAFWFSINVVASTTYDFIALLKKKKKELEFESAELALEKHEIEESANEFTIIRKKFKALNTTYKFLQRKKKKIGKILEESEEFTEELEKFSNKSQEKPNSINQTETKIFIKRLKKYIKSRVEATAILSEIEKFEKDLQEFQDSDTLPK